MSTAAPAKASPTAQPDTIRRVIHPEIKVVSETAGTIEYIASDETLDHYREVVIAGGWRFKFFKKNAPFVDSHNYGSIATVLGRVLSWEVKGDKLVETVQWAKDMPDTLASWGWKMVVGGFLKAVSVGFWPTKMVTKWDADKTGWLAALKKHDLHEEDGVAVIYLEQEQVELSACVLGANPNAVAKAFKAGALKDEDIDRMEQYFSRKQAQTEIAARAPNPVVARAASSRLAGDMQLAVELRRLANRLS